MTRLIDADDALGRYYAEWEKQDIYDGAEDRDWLKKCIDEAPTVDAEPVRHGKWEMVRHNICNVDFRCSACRKFKFHNGEMRKVYKYCPGCGAMMEIESEPAEQMHLF